MKRKRKNRCKAKLRLYPDPILKAVCEPVGDGEDVSGIIRDMMHILTNSKTGVGLAAPQAGHLKRVAIAKTGDCAFLVMINPHIITFCGSGYIAQEGCLSYPGIFKELYRPNWIKVVYEDEGGLVETGEYYNFDARIIQHEIDHLNGQCKVGGES